MRRRVFLALALVFALFALGALAAVAHITRITSSLGHLIELHQVENLRQHLIINVQTVQADFYRVGTSLASGLDFIVDHVAKLDEAAARCGSCHHEPGIARQIAGLEGLLDEYKDALSYFLTAAANAERIEQLRREAAEAGARVLALTQQMAVAANQRLRDLTYDSLLQVDRARTILVVTLLLAFGLAGAVAGYLVRSITRPVGELLDATRAIAAGGYGHTVEYRDASELGELARHFNAMSAALRRSDDDRRRQQEQLAESERKFRTLSEFASDWEHWIDPGGRLVFMSSSCEEITGYPLADYERDPGLAMAIVHPEDRARVEGHLGGDTDPRHEETEFRIVTRTGEVKWLSHVCGPILSEGRLLGRFASNRDITDRKRLEEQLFQAQKMES
ncbi:MAG: PAS domain S-box protein, partial [Deferrisomatales bacterium]